MSQSNDGHTMHILRRLFSKKRYAHNACCCLSFNSDDVSTFLENWKLKRQKFGVLAWHTHYLLINFNLMTGLNVLLRTFWLLQWWNSSMHTHSLPFKQIGVETRNSNDTFLSCSFLLFSRFKLLIANLPSAFKIQQLCEEHFQKSCTY